MSEWSIEITPHKKWYDIDFKGLWRYRDLYYMYIKRDIIVQYKQTVLGPLWYLIQPVFTTVMYMFVFGGLAGISTDGVPQPLFYMAGIMMWNYFNSVFSASSSLFVANAGVFGKVYFPRLIVPLATATSNLLKFLIQLLLFVAVYVFFICVGEHISPNWTIVTFPLIVIMVGVFGMSSGLIISSMTTKYRDLNQLVNFGVQLYMYATPIIYPLSAAPEKYKDIIMLNPLSPMFEAVRYSWMGCGTISWGGLLYSFAFTLVLTVFAVVIFSKTERTFMDTV
ncbi:MAG: ABC transporter permease [Muribaculaceae bacterium]|nr:ABC transporter permease [Muribaculaceae bacterium]MDE6692777.1 ABC transporter permease [Muribaculaceae bacterium]